MADTFNVQLPDGRLLQGIPLGTTKEEIAAKAGIPLDASTEPTVKPDAPQLGIVAGIKRGAAGAVIGTAQLLKDAGADTILRPLGRELPSRDVLNAAAQSLQEQGKGTGFAGTVGELTGNPLSYVVPPASLGGITAVGGAIGATQAIPNDNSFKDRVGAAAVGALTGRVAGSVGQKVAPLVADAGANLGARSAALTGDFKRFLLGSWTGPEAQRAVYQNAAQKLIEQGITPNQLTAMASNASDAGLGATLPEFTGNRGMLLSQKALAKGTNAAANTMMDYAETRNRVTLPNAIQATGQGITDRAGDVSALYDSAAAEAAARPPAFTDKSGEIAAHAEDYASLQDLRNNLLQSIQDKGELAGKQLGFFRRRTITSLAEDAKNLDNVKGQIAAKEGDIASTEASQYSQDPALFRQPLTHILRQIDNRISQLGDVSNVEGQTLKKSRAIMENALTRGDDPYAALRDARSQLDNIFIDNADNTTQKKAASYAAGFRSQVNDALSNLAPSVKVADTAFKQKLGGQSIVDTVTSTNRGHNGTLYNRLFGTDDQLTELQRRIGDQEFGKLQNTINSFQDVLKGGLAGSDTAPLTNAIKENQAQAGGNLFRGLTNLNEVGGIFLGKIRDAIQSKNDAALVDLYTNPDVKKLSTLMQSRLPDASKAKLALPLLQSLGRTIAPVAIEATQAQPALTYQPKLTASAMPQATVQPLSYTGSMDVPVSPLDGYSDKVAMLESSNNPNAQASTSSAKGAQQFTDGTWNRIVAKYGKEYKLTPDGRTNKRQSDTATELLAQENGPQLASVLGRDPDQAELYLAHVMGAGGAKALIKNSDKPIAAASLSPAAAKANRALFFRDGKPLTPAQVIDNLRNKFDSV